ncbi:MAG: EamA family transporter [Planctomycetaceae bacterium]
MPDSATTAEVRTARLMLLAAALLWSLSGVIMKSPPMERMPLEWRGPVSACWRAVFAVAVLLPFIRPAHVRFRPALVPMTLGFAAMNVLYLTALTMTTAAAAIFLQSTSTFWALVFGAVFLHERIERRSALAVGCALVGIAWIVADDWGGENSRGNFIALASGVSYAVVVLSLRSLRQEGSAWLIAVGLGVSAVLLAPVAMTHTAALDGSQWALLAVLGAFQMAAPYILFARGLRAVTAQEAALITLIEPVLNPLLVWLAWGEPASRATLTGGGLILLGLSLRYAAAFRRRPPARPASSAQADRRDETR